MPFMNKLRSGEVMECGLIYYLPDIRIPVPIPLTSVKIDAKIVDFVSEISVRQEYINRESNPIEAVYMFPVEEEAAVVEFEAELDGRTIRTVIKEKEEARKEYDEAVQAQKTAFLLEETKPDIFQIKVGHLKPGSSAKITIKYVSELPVEAKAVRLTIPTTIAPRYVPPTDKSEEAKRIASIPYKFDSPAPLSIAVTAVMKHSIKSMRSPSHDLKVSETRQEAGKFVTSASLTASTTDLDRDFIVLVEGDNIHEPVAFLENNEKSGTSVGMVTLVPFFNLKEQPVELIFLVDRSGSMQGSSILQARKALQLFLHSMPASCLFNIYSFGSRFDSLFEHSVEYTDTTLEEAKKLANEMEASYGGTEILQPLEEIFKVPPKHGHLRQIFVLTDGEVSNDHQVIALVKKNASHGRVFSLGLGNSCSRHLVKGIARAGDGTAAFAAEGEDLRPKVMAQLKNSLQPAIKNVSVEWSGVTAEIEATGGIPLTGQAPLVIPPVYDGSRLLVYRLFSQQSKPTGVKVIAETPDGPLSFELALDKASYIEGHFLHQLAARKRIQDLEEANAEQYDAEAVKKAIVQLGKEYSLASKHTSFIGVDPKDTEKYYGRMLQREIANQVPHGFGGFQAQCYSAAPMAMACSAGRPMMRQRKCMSVGAPAPPPPVAMMSNVACDYAMLESLTDSAAPLVEKEKTEDDLMSDIIDLQGSSGVFNWGKALEVTLKMSLEDVKQKLPTTVQGLTLEIWITALAVAYLEVKMSAAKDLWELVVVKAKKYVEKSGHSQQEAFKMAHELVLAL